MLYMSTHFDLKSRAHGIHVNTDNQVWLQLSGITYKRPTTLRRIVVTATGVDKIVAKAPCSFGW